MRECSGGPASAMRALRARGWRGCAVGTERRQREAKALATVLGLLRADGADPEKRAAALHRAYKRNVDFSRFAQ